MAGIIIFCWLWSPKSPVAHKHWFGDYDATDDWENKKRSGVSIVIDYGTGVQYIATPIGGITPRLDSNGNVMKVEQSHDR